MILVIKLSEKTLKITVITCRQRYFLSDNLKSNKDQHITKYPVYHNIPFSEQGIRHMSERVIEKYSTSI